MCFFLISGRKLKITDVASLGQYDNGSFRGPINPELEHNINYAADTKGYLQRWGKHFSHILFTSRDEPITLLTLDIIAVKCMCYCMLVGGYRIGAVPENSKQNRVDRCLMGSTKILCPRLRVATLFLIMNTSFVNSNEAMQKNYVS